MEKRKLGKTGYMSSVMVFGAAAFWETESQHDADELLDLAIQKGINYLDVAPLYGCAEDRIGNWLPTHRNNLFVSSKTLKRNRDEAWAELNRSLEKLRINCLDLYQLHAIGSFNELDKVFQSDGAIHALVQAKDQGLIRHIGITGHGILTPQVHTDAIKRFPFDTIMFPINPSLYSINDYRDASEKLLSLTLELEIGVIAIKAVARGKWKKEDEKKYLPWYEPFDEQDKIDEGVHFTLSQPVTAIASPGDPRLFRKVLLATETFKPLDASTQKLIISNWSNLDKIFP